MAALIVAALMVPTADVAVECPGAGRTPAAEETGAARQATLCLLNRERDSAGLPSLRPSGKLREAADDHSRDMVKRRFFSHTAPGGVTFTERIRAVGYLDGATWSIAENIGYGSGSFSSPRSMVRRWMRSPGHRANILDPALRDAGTGLALGTPTGEDGATYTLDLGRRYR